MEKSLWTDLPGPQSSAAATISAKPHAMGLRILVYSDTEKISYISIRLITTVRDLGFFMEPDDFHKETCQMKGTVTPIEIKRFYSTVELFFIYCMKHKIKYKLNNETPTPSNYIKIRYSYSKSTEYKILQGNLLKHTSTQLHDTFIASLQNNNLALIQPGHRPCDTEEETG